MAYYAFDMGVVPQRKDALRPERGTADVTAGRRLSSGWLIPWLVRCAGKCVRASSRFTRPAGRVIGAEQADCGGDACRRVAA